MEQNLHFGPSETGYLHWCNNRIVIRTSIVEFARDLFELGSLSRTDHETGGIMEGKIEKLKEEKRTLKTSITKLLNELAAQLLTKMPNKENVTEKLQDCDKRRDELLELLESLQTLHGENKHVSLAASTGDEVDKLIDRVDNETKEAQLFLIAK